MASTVRLNAVERRAKRSRSTAKLGDSPRRCCLRCDPEGIEEPCPIPLYCHGGVVVAAGLTFRATWLAHNHFAVQEGQTGAKQPNRAKGGGVADLGRDPWEFNDGPA